MSKPSISLAGVDAGSRPGGQRSGANVGRRISSLMEALRQRSWGSEAALSGLAFLELVATHSRPPEALRPFRQALIAALSPRLSDRHRADQLRCAASMLARRPRRETWAVAAGLILCEYAASLDARPEERMELIQLCQREMGLAPIAINAPIPRLAMPPKQSGPTLGGLTELINAQVHALCMSALCEACVRHPYAAWSMRDIDAALFALRYQYVNGETTLCGESATAAQRREDFEGVGRPLWETLSRAATRRAGTELGSKPLGDDGWHQRTQAAIFLAIGAARIEIKAEGLVALPPADGPKLVVCRRPITPSSDRHDKEEIERHLILERPLPMAVMPRRAEIEAAHHRLLSEFPWAEDVLAIVFGDLLGRAAVGAALLSMPPTLLVGHPGSGKSRLARRLADELGLPSLDLCLGGSSDAKMLGGTSRGWGSSKPGDLATLLAMHRSASAIVLLDELDKAHDHQRDGVGIQSYLLGLVEPETAARHHDVFLKTECDFSGVLWLATANTLSGIAPALRTRFRVLLLRQPSPDHLEVIAQNAIADVADRWGVARQVLPELGDLDLPLDRLASARQVRLATEVAISLWARELQRH